MLIIIILPYFCHLFIVLIQGHTQDFCRGGYIGGPKSKIAVESGILSQRQGWIQEGAKGGS